MQSVEDQSGFVAGLSTHRICCGVGMGAQDLWRLLSRVSSQDLSCRHCLSDGSCCPCGQLQPLVSPVLCSGYQEQLCSSKGPGMMESGSPPPIPPPPSSLAHRRSHRILWNRFHLQVLGAWHRPGMVEDLFFKRPGRMQGVEAAF